MWRYPAKRLLEAVPTTAGVLLLTFVLFHVMAGSPAEVALGQHATAASLAAFDRRHGYDKPLLGGHWARSRAWSETAPLPTDGKITPYFPLESGRWRLEITIHNHKGQTLQTSKGQTPEADDSHKGQTLMNRKGQTLKADTTPNYAPQLTILLESIHKGQTLQTSKGQTPGTDDSHKGQTLQVSTRALEVMGTSSAGSTGKTPGLLNTHPRWRFVWDVPDGWQAIAAILPSTAITPASRAVLSRRTAHFFDSQLICYLSDLGKGDLGESTAYGMRVATVLKQGAGPSLMLTIPILIGGTLLALMLALLAALWRGQAPDRGVLLGSTTLMSVNYVVWVLAGQYLFAYKLALFPIWGFEHWTYLILPVIIGIVSGMGRDIRFYRTVILDEMHSPYIRTAMAKGLSSGRIISRHLLPNCLIPIMTYVSLSIPFLFTGSLLLESFFGIPGLGGVSLNAINSADMATVRAIVILGALLYQFVNLLADIAYAWLDPRVRLG